MKRTESSHFQTLNESSSNILSRENVHILEIIEKYHDFLTLFDVNDMYNLDSVSRAKLIHSIYLTLQVIKDLNEVSGESDHIRLMYIKYLRLAREDYFNKPAQLIERRGHDD